MLFDSVDAMITDYAYKILIRRRSIDINKFKANYGNSRTFKAVNSENKIQAHLVFKYKPCDSVLCF